VTVMKYETRNGICIYQSEGPLWHMLLCKLLKIHHWSYFRMANSFIEAFPNDYSVHRRCKRCSMMQLTDDGTSWRARH